MEAQIRFLIEQYYDIQKLRVEAFNRIVAYVKSQFSIESQTTNVSQQKIESHVEHASHNKSDPQYVSAVKPSEIAHKIVKGEIKAVSYTHLTLPTTERV